MTRKAYLVGAGPGRADLITRRGLQLLRQADVILYDRLIGAELLHETQEMAELIFVGKRPGHHVKQQKEINQILLNSVRAGKQVVRLKGGDPFVFGRGGEEALCLVENGYAFEVVPGVTSSLAVPTYAGVPVTHKNMAAGFAILTGYEDPTKPRNQTEWSALAHVSTLVVLMTVKNIKHLVSNLLDAGRVPETPAMAISHGTIVQQRTVQGTLSTLADQIKQEKLPTPATIVIGDVVTLADSLSWFQPDESSSHFVSMPVPLAEESNNQSRRNELYQNDHDDTGYLNWLSKPIPTGRVYLVGAGSGDPMLLTIRGQKALQQADVILYDRLSAPELLSLAKPGAFRINVGKGQTCNRYPQSEINRLLVQYGKTGQTVVRLKGGDPFVFGLGGDECLTLKEAGISYEVVPGVSSMTAVPAYAGIPVTHRGVSTMLTVLSAHDADSVQIGGIPWAYLPKQGTLVILMGAKRLPLIVKQLLAFEFKTDSSIAIIESGTTSAQKITQSTLLEMQQAPKRVEPPALIVVGEVVRLRAKLDWFDANLVATNGVEESN